MVYYVEEAALNVEMDSSPRKICTGTEDVVFVPANEPHRLSNCADLSSRSLMVGAGLFTDVDFHVQ